jgi:hypothetical protein
MIEAAQTILLAGGVIAALAVIGRFVRASYRFVRRLDLIHATILHELLPNNGGSIKDQINRIDKRVERLESLTGESPTVV